MNDHNAFKRSATRYWERRRILYNLALVPPSVLMYLFAAGVMSVGDPAPHLWYVLLLFALFALGANLCFTFVYVLEFFFGTDAPASRWLRYGRIVAFIAGTLLAMLLAAFGGINIAAMDHNLHW